MLKGFFHLGRKRLLNSLSFERPNDPKTNSAANRAAKLTEKKQAQTSVSWNAQGGKQSAENWWEVIVSGPYWWEHAESAFNRGNKRGTLQAAGAIGDVVGREGIEHLIQFRETFQIGRASCRERA